MPRVVSYAARLLIGPDGATGVFTVEGPAGKSYGVKVAELAGIPLQITERAARLLHQHELSAAPSIKPEYTQVSQLSLFEKEDESVRGTLFHPVKSPINIEEHDKFKNKMMFKEIVYDASPFNREMFPLHWGVMETFDLNICKMAITGNYKDYLHLYTQHLSKDEIEEISQKIIL